MQAGLGVSIRAVTLICFWGGFGLPILIKEFRNFTSNTAGQRKNRLPFKETGFFEIQIMNPSTGGRGLSVPHDEMFIIDEVEFVKYNIAFSLRSGECRPHPSLCHFIVDHYLRQGIQGGSRTSLLHQRLGASAAIDVSQPFEHRS